MKNVEFIFKTNPSLKISKLDLLRFTRECAVKKVAKASFFIMPGDESKYLPFVISGIFKVYKSAENGREITLYRIEDGQSCILSALSILNNSKFPATVEAEIESEVLLIPSKLLRYFVDIYPEWRNYIFSMYNDRFDIIITLIDELLFRKLDLRLSAFLLRKCESYSKIIITHQEIAYELGSSREVISRLLKDFESQGILKLGRGSILVKDISKLSKKAALM